MLRLDGVRITQGDFTLTATLDLTPGLTAVIGPSGGGKSTLLAVIAGFIAPATGAVIWQDRPITTLAPGARPVSVLFQDNNLFPHLTVAQNVGLGLRPDLKLTAADHNRVQEVLTAVGLPDMGPRKPAALSGGQQSRAALARVLLADRPVVLLDEPFAALGPALRSEMLALVRDTLAGRTVVMVTHDPADARAVAGQVVLVAEGRAYPPQDMQALFANPPAALRAYLGEG